MQYAVLGDIHGNFAALQTVWRELEAAGLTDRTILNSGDSVGYGDFPEACVEFLRKHTEIISVRGNYDKSVALFPERDGEYRKNLAKSRPEKLEAIRRDSAAISEISRHWLLDLPREVELTLEEVPLLITHYAPGRKEGLGSWTPDYRLNELAAQTSARVVVCGHTHTPFVRSVGGVLWINPGSLGRSFDGQHHYAILTLESGLEPSAALHVTR